MSAPGIAPTTTLRPPTYMVLRDLPPEARTTQVDWTRWHLNEDDVAQSFEQGDIIRLLVSSLQELARERGWTKVLVGSDNYVAWVPAHPRVRVSPDVFLVDDPPPGRLPKSWQTWLPGHKPPRWSVEIVSEDWRKDYDDAPAKYGQMGCRELVLFDPDAARGDTRHPGRAPLVVYRRAEDGAFVEVYRGEGPAYSEQLGVWLLARLELGWTRLRLSHDEAGERLVQTADEARAKEAEARAKAEARMRDLEEELARTRGGP